MNPISDVSINAGVFLAITTSGMLGVMIATSAILNNALKEVSSLRDKAEADRVKITTLEGRILKLETAYKETEQGRAEETMRHIPATPTNKDSGAHVTS